MIITTEPCLFFNNSESRTDNLESPAILIIEFNWIKVFLQEGDCRLVFAFSYCLTHSLVVENLGFLFVTFTLLEFYRIIPKPFPSYFL